MTGMFADDSDLYVSIRNDFYDASYGSRVLKVDSSGQSVWEYSVADDAARLIGIGDGRIYVATGTHLAALDAATGAPVWQAGPQPVTALLAKGNPAIPVIVAADAVFGISPTTGTVQWSLARWRSATNRLRSVIPCWSIRPLDWSSLMRPPAQSPGPRHCR